MTDASGKKQVSGNHGARRSGPPSLAKVRHIIAIASGKGGVGKSTLSANLAVALKHYGAKVALLDADIYGASQPGMFGAEAAQLTVEGDMLQPVEKYGISFVSMGLLVGRDGPVVWRAPMVIKLLMQFLGQVNWGEQDYLLIDLPPGTGDIQLTLAQQASLSGAVIVTTPQQVALGIAEKGMRMFEQVKVPILGIVENMSGYVCEHCGKTTSIFKRGGGAKMADEFGVPLLGTIPLDKDIMQSGDDGVPVVSKVLDTPAAKAFLKLAEAVKAEVEGGQADPSLPRSTKLTENGQFVIEWGDGEVSTYEPYTLRVACGCASCVDENTGQRVLDPKRVPLDIKIKDYIQTGNYAITFTFSDGHDTGIYPFDRLRDQIATVKPQEPFAV